MMDTQEREFEMFYEEMNGTYERLVRRIVTDRGDQQEAMQQGWLNIWLHWRELAISKRTHYGAVVMHNAALDVVRKTRVHPAGRRIIKMRTSDLVPLDLDAHDRADEAERGPEEVLLARECLIELVSPLSTQDQKSITYLLAGYDHETIATREQITIGNSKRRRRVAIAAIRARLLQRERKAS